VNIPVPSRIRSLGKKLVYGYLPGTAGAFPYYGSKVYFPRGSAVFDLICKNGIFEPEIVHLLLKLTRAETTIFDVGANLGLMALPMLQACRTCRVVSFEPSPNSLRFLRQTVEACTHRSRWSIVEKALSDVEGQSEFFLAATTNSMFDGLRSQERTGHQTSVTVPVSTLDKEWRELGRPTVSVIKIDVEGAEGLVLKGARELLKEMTPALVIEWVEDYLLRYDTPAEMILSIASEFDYRLFSVPTGVPIDDHSSLRVQMITCSNFLLVKRTS
jgi:FkbM family methyltransferase